MIPIKRLRVVVGHFDINRTVIFSDKAGGKSVESITYLSLLLCVVFTISFSHPFTYAINRLVYIYIRSQ